MSGAGHSRLGSNSSPSLSNGGRDPVEGSSDSGWVGFRRDHTLTVPWPEVPRALHQSVKHDESWGIFGDSELLVGDSDYESNDEVPCGVEGPD